MATEALPPQLEEKLAKLTGSSGVYLFKDLAGTIIYVGKAKNLKSRVRSYFRSPDQHTIKTRTLMTHVQDLDTILTANEVEALLCERSMIKHHRPKFNILLRDDKEFPSLRIDFRDRWPRIEKVRRRKSDGATYLGPFTNPGQLRQVLDLVYKVYPLIRCSRHIFESTARPCNYYHMKMCLAPCTLPVDRESYVAMLKGAVDLVDGQNRKVANDLKLAMQSASQNQEYEAAARIRDQLIALEAISQKQSVVIQSDAIIDAVGLIVHDESIALNIIHIRQGTISGQDSFVLHAPVEERSEILGQVLLQYYDQRTPPEEILLPEAVEHSQELAEALAKFHQLPKIPIFRTPQRGDLADLVAIAQNNARQHLGEYNASRDRLHIELTLVRERLKLPEQPKRIECIDISNLQATAIVASNVCFIDGKAAKHQYRHYTIEDVNDKPDDFASIREVVRRRILRILEDDDAPNLLVIDGGASQLKSALEAIEPFRGNPAIDSMTVVGLAKSRNESLDIESTDAPRFSMERIFTDPKLPPVPLKPGSPEFRLLTRIRDEAHRFALGHHRKRRAKHAHASILESIKGIGPTLRRRLLQQFGGMDGLRLASLDEIRQVKGMHDDIAIAIHSYLRSEPDN